MRTWARAEALPILAALAAKADARFQGVRDLSKAIDKRDPKDPIDVPALTDRNPSYWRALLEMAPGNPLVPAIRIALYAANGEIDQARRYINVTTFFDANQSGPSRLNDDLRTMMGMFYKDVESRIGQGVALHDKGRFAEALAVYDNVLRDYPSSAWTQYESFHTRRAMMMSEKKAIDESHAGWSKVREAILARDPLYEVMAEAKGADEIYRLVLRAEINSLFKERDKTVRDLVRYADIARDLEVYGFAAMLDWNILTAVKPEEYDRRELAEDFLFCLEQLGVKDLKENFRGDHASAFARIKAERQKRVEAGPGGGSKEKPAARP
jgi:tetratricopeptide (TPR) repeat protein